VCLVEKKRYKGEQQSESASRLLVPGVVGRLCLRLPCSFYPVEGYIQLALDVLLLVDSAMTKETGGSEHVRGEERGKTRRRRMVRGVVASRELGQKVQ
jgi:hypothetical protein